MAQRGLIFRQFCVIVLHMRVRLDNEVYLDAVEAARRIGVSDETIRRWIRLGKLQARRLGIKYLILERDVKELARKRG